MSMAAREGDGSVLARVYRGESVEAVHYGSIAVVDGEGRLTHYAGDPEFKTMTRSSIKPFQLIPLLTTGAADRFGFTPRQLAIMCGSHIGSDEHREVVVENLKCAGVKSSDLRCGCHWPMGMEAALRFPQNGEERDPLRHNCSGKHSGFLALAKFLGDPIERYLEPESAGQTMVREALASICEYPADEMPVGIDGCSAPNYPLPLYNLAVGFKKLANLDASDSGMMQVLARIKGGMTEFPEMVSGEGRFDYDLARSFPGNLVCKVGAEGLEAIGLSDPACGIVVKIYDGSFRPLGAVCVAVLKELGLIRGMDEFPYLKRHETPEVRNARGIVTGKIVADVTLQKV